LLVKYFKQNGEFWQISPELRAMVQHRQLNLLHDFSQLGIFDVIFCTRSPMPDTPHLRDSGSRRLSIRYCLSADRSRPE
jgi:hypothetical protein